MSWREVLGHAGSAGESYTHNSHNTQNYPEAGTRSDTNTPATEESDEVESRLLEVLNRICEDLPVAPRTALDALSAQDIAEWHRGEIDGDTLRAFATALSWRLAREQGRRADCDTEPALCRRCGPIWACSSATVDACPWCRNRRSGRPIPRPVRVRCGTCARFRPDIVNPAAGVGHCADGRNHRSTPCFPKLPRDCDYWLPRRVTETDLCVDPGSSRDAHR